MGVKDVRLDPKLNQELWKQGIKNVPHRVRVKLERECHLLTTKPGYNPMFLGKRNDEEDAKEKLYVYASHLPVASFKVYFACYLATLRLRVTTRVYKLLSLMWSDCLFFVHLFFYHHSCTICIMFL